jgi:hypothetical protein
MPNAAPRAGVDVDVAEAVADGGRGGEGGAVAQVKMVNGPITSRPGPPCAMFSIMKP